MKMEDKYVNVRFKIFIVMMQGRRNFEEPLGFDVENRSRKN